MFRVLAFTCALVSAVAEEGKKKDVVVESMNYAVSGTLIATLSFIMVLYYFTNYPDPDIQASSWNAINSTISIFCAVLLFQSFNAAVEDAVIDPLFGDAEASVGALLVDMAHMVVWYTLLQVTLAQLSGAVFKDRILDETLCPKPKYDDAPDVIKEKWRQRKREQHRRGLDLQCGGLLMAHLTGFASINAFGTVQQFEFFKQTPLHSLLVVPIAILGQVMLQHMFDRIRIMVWKVDDGVKSWWEDKWVDQAKESEDDVIGLTVSFLIINAARSAITGCLPNQEGAEEECAEEDYLYKHTMKQKLLMFGLWLLCGALTYAVLFKIEVKEEEEKEEKADGEETGDEEEIENAAEDFHKRSIAFITNVVRFMSSWAFFFNAQMWLAGIPKLKGMDELLEVVVAIVLSIVGFFSMIVLDNIADADLGQYIEKAEEKIEKAEQKAKKIGKVVGHKLKLRRQSVSLQKYDEKIDRAIRHVMLSIGISIGFAWEQCFDKSVDTLAENTFDHPRPFLNPSAIKIYLSVFCSALLLPAWRLYIVPYIATRGWEFSGATDLVGRFAHPKYITDEKKKAAQGKINDKMEKHVIKIKKLVQAAIVLSRNAKKSKSNKNLNQEELLQRLMVEEGASEEVAKFLNDIDKDSDHEKECPAKHAEVHPSAKNNEVEELKKQLAQKENELTLYRQMISEHMRYMGGTLTDMNESMNRIRAP